MEVADCLPCIQSLQLKTGVNLEDIMAMNSRATVFAQNPRLAEMRNDNDSRE